MRRALINVIAIEIVYNIIFFPIPNCIVGVKKPSDMIDTVIINPMYIIPAIIVVKEIPFDSLELVNPQTSDPPINAIIAVKDIIAFGSSYLQATNADIIIIINDVEIAAATEKNEYFISFFIYRYLPVFCCFYKIYADIKIYIPISYLSCEGTSRLIYQIFRFKLNKFRKIEILRNLGDIS